MKFPRRFVLPLAALLLVAGAKKNPPTVRFYVETSGSEINSFSQKVQLIGTQREIYVSSIPVVTEHDVVAVYPFQATDGTAGCAFKLDNHGRMSLDSASVDRHGLTMVVMVCGRHVMDMLIDQRNSDGIITISRGMAAIETAVFAKKYPVMGHGKAKKGDESPKLSVELH